MIAAVSAPYTSATSTSSFTPPASANGGKDAWSYSVPLENQLLSETANDYDNHETIHSRRPLTGQTNGHQLSGKASRTNLSQRPPPSRSNQLPDKGYSTRISTATAPKNHSMNEPSHDQYVPSHGADFADDDDPEHSRWIHKDKLERMELEEMERLGIKIPRSGASSRSKSRSKSRDAHHRSEQLGHLKKQRVEAALRDGVEENAWDLRLPEERDVQGPFWDQPAASRSVSRIPVCKTSPMPISLDTIERDPSMPHGKNSGPVGADNAAPPSQSRGRSGSIKPLGNANAPNNPVATARVVSGRHSAATDGPPTKKIAPRKNPGPATGASNHQRPKTRSGSNGTRLANRSGDFGSGGVSKRPEGDPPWLATMYKPDPRLPPDQQLLPTHAKRMHQEQWEKDGKFGNTYDTSFRPLNIEDFGEPPKPASPPPPEVEVPQVEIQNSDPQPDSPPEPLPAFQPDNQPDPQPDFQPDFQSDPQPDPRPDLLIDAQPELQAGWPLRSPKSPALATGRPSTAVGGGAGGGGSYSTMPKIPSPRPLYVSPLASSSVTQITSTVRVPDGPAEEKGTAKRKAAGCASCVVM